ncbi:hypothetical protein [Eubacterium barkeri]|uniref:Uncharacterized protein n=1 Tax=Eubacterium barkeri TaxID=1528 RepID=A0A1H3HEL4_EUBBA|nr:hypothetical protein [Eubacterium barkeri]SDY13288.1 hypothetical protein SAMN04488579_11746 [Eubacterium barkeri]
MAYVDVNYYTETYRGTVLIGDDMAVKLDRASDQVDVLTFNRIVGRGFDNLTDFQQEQVKIAVCAHADFTEEYGTYFNSPLSGYSAGSLSVSFNSDAVVNYNGVQTSREAYGYLQKTGLVARRL